MAVNPKNTVQSVAKAFSVLQAFDSETLELTISEVSSRTGLDRGTSFRLIHTLCDLGYMAAVPRSRRFRITLKCLELGYASLARSDLKVHVAPLLRELIPDIADAGSLGMLDGTDVVYVERVQDGPVWNDVDRRVGSRASAYGAALGHTLLAFMPVDQQREILEATNRIKLSERTLTGIDELLERFADVRERGYAISDRENAYGLRTVAAPIFDEDRKPIAGVSLTIRAERSEIEEFVAIAVPEVLRVTAELTRAVCLSYGAIRQSNYFGHNRNGK